MLRWQKWGTLLRGQITSEIDPGLLLSLLLLYNMLSKGDYAPIWCGCWSRKVEITQEELEEQFSLGARL